MQKIDIKLENENVGKVYQIELDKLIYVLSKLENDDSFKLENFTQLETIMHKYGLYDEAFLSNINLIW